MSDCTSIHLNITKTTKPTLKRITFLNSLKSFDDETYERCENKFKKKKFGLVRQFSNLLVGVIIIIIKSIQSICKPIFLILLL